MIFNFEKEKLNIIHEEPEGDWEEIEITVPDECIDSLYEIEKELSKYDLTLNDFFIAVLKKEISKTKKR